MIHLKTILHPTDFSEDSQCALEVACALARNQATRLILLHVVPRPIVIGTDPNVPAYKEAHADEDLQADRWEMSARLEKLRGEVSVAQVETLLKEGDVPEVIVRTAEMIPCDLIVMGTHGASRAYQSMMGSVTAAVTENAPCPVVTVKLPVSWS